MTTIDIRAGERIDFNVVIDLFVLTHFPKLFWVLEFHCGRLWLAVLKLNVHRWTHSFDLRGNDELNLECDLG
jgi:hypothetical protein